MRRILIHALLTLGLLATGAAARAQSYPSKPIRLLIAFGAGGAADIVTRVLTDKMAPSLGQPFVLENRPGAGGNLAMEAVAKAPPDGYTLLFIGPAVAINGTLYKNLPFDPLKDLVHVSLIGWGPYALFVNSALPVHNVAELVAYAKSKPGQLNYASVGVGTGGHLAAVLFAMAAGVEMTHVPYKSIQQAATDLVSGQVHLVFNAYPPLAQFQQSGKLRLLGFSGTKRLAEYPNVPTVAESGLPGFEATGWYGVFAPARVPRELLVRLNTEIVNALRQRDVIERIEKVGFEVSPQTPDEAVRFVNAEAEKWGRAVKASGATAD